LTNITLCVIIRVVPVYLNKRKQENESSQKVEPLWLVSHLEARQVTDYPHDSGEWTVVLYERPNGKSPVAEFIEEQPKRNQAKIFAELDDLAEFGLMPRGNKLRYMDSKLWELRFRGEGVNYRLFFFPDEGRRMVVLHGFCKKTPKTPKRELETARQRLKTYLGRPLR